MDWTYFLQQLINGFSLGAFYALIALGYTMVYGVLRFINFAHGDVFMIGAFAGYWLTPRLMPKFGGGTVTDGVYAAAENGGLQGIFSARTPSPSPHCSPTVRSKTPAR